MRRAVLLSVLTLAGCTASDLTLYVDLKTDLVPEVEFASVRTRVATGDNARALGEATYEAARADDAAFERGVRVAELAAQPGSLMVTVELLDRAGNVVVARRVLQSVSTTSALTVVITRTCVGASCPGAGDDPSATECAGRRCVPPECVTGEEPTCERECTGDDDCPAPADCATAICVEGACFAGSDGTTCGAGTFCHPMRGCVADPDLADAGEPTPDAGAPDAGASCGDCDDANPCTDDACEAGTCTHTNNTASCDDGVFCNGPDTCGDGSCSVHPGSPCVGSTVCSEDDDTCTGCLTDADCPGESATSWGTCSFDETCSESGTQSREVTSWTCDAGACVIATETESQAGSHTTTGMECGETTMGSWSGCGGFSGGACDETGTRTRPVTTYACAAGACEPSTSTETGSCTRDTDGTSCGATMTGSWSGCSGYTGGTCDETGTRSRSVTTYACAAGGCDSSTTTETGSCTRDTDGTSCGTTSYGSWSTCGGFTGGTCDETGTRSRSVTTYACAAGGCDSSTSTQTGSCTRDRDGISCGTTTYGAWSACSFTGGTCDETGTRTRTVTTYACAAGGCEATTTTQSGSCTRDRDGVSCGTTTYGSWGACGGFIGTCGESGTRHRSMTTYTCGGGTCNGTSGTDTTSCTRNTDYDDCTRPFEFPCTVSYCLNGTCGNRGDTCGYMETCCEFGCRTGPCL